MEKLKDFFYDKNDLVVALIIILLAGILISWRVGAIMDYPKVLAAELEQQGSGDLSSHGTMSNDPDGTGTGSPEDPGSDTQTPGLTTPSGTTTTTPPAAGTTTSGAAAGQNGSSGTTNKPASGASITITIPSGSSSDKIAQILMDAGLVSSKSAFTNAVVAADADRKLKAGTFTIPAGSTAAQVVAIITK